MSSNQSHLNISHLGETHLDYGNVLSTLKTKYVFGEVKLENSQVWYWTMTVIYDVASYCKLPMQAHQILATQQQQL